MDLFRVLMSGSEHPSTVTACRAVSRLLASSACSAAELRAGLRCAAGAGDLGDLLEDLTAALDPDRLAAGDEAGAQLPAASALRCLGAAPVPCAFLHAQSSMPHVHYQPRGLHRMVCAVLLEAGGLSRPPCVPLRQARCWRTRRLGWRC